MRIDCTPAVLAAARPIRRYPACAIELYASRRFRFVCPIALRFPSVIVIALMIPMIAGQGSSVVPAYWPPGMLRSNAAKKKRMATANPAALGPTERNAVNGVGAPSYTSGHHMWNGTLAIL